MGCLVLWLLVGCGQAEASRCLPTLEHVRVWPGTVDGPARLAETLGDERHPLELRRGAAIALLDLERGDVSPLELLADALEPDADGALSASLVEPVVERLAVDGDTSGGLQVRAKELALRLHPRVDADARARLSEVVMGWYAEDLAARQRAGGTSFGEAVEILGAPAEGALLDLLAPRRGAPAMTLAAEALAAREDEGLAVRAAERLRAAEDELRSPAFLTWLEGRVRESLRARGEVDEARIQTAARLNRETIVREGLLVSMQHLCAVPSVADRLVELARAAPAGTSITDAADRRAYALRALEGCVEPRHAETVVGLALDDAEPLGVRDHALDRAAELGGPVVSERLWAALEGDPLGWRLHWRVGAIVLGSMDASELPRFLAALRDGEYAPEQLAGFAEAIAALQPPPGDEATGAMIEDRRWFVRVLGLHVLRALDAEAASAAAARLSSDRAALVGPRWSPRTTVADVARSGAE